MARERLPDERKGVTHRFRITDRNGDVTAGYLQTGEYESGALGELFIKVGKPGDETAVWDEVATMFSVALQYGVPLEVMCAKLRAKQFEPAGSTSNSDIPRCTSISDYIARYLTLRYSSAGATI